MAAKKKKVEASNITIHMPGQHVSWLAATTTSTLGDFPSVFSISNMPLNGWSVPDVASGGDLATGVTGIGFLAGQGGRIDNELRFKESELFIPTNVAESKVGPIQPWACQDSAGTPALTYYPQEWTTVPFCQELVIVSTDKSMLENWQEFTAGTPDNNPLFRSFQVAATMGEQSVTYGAGVPLLSGTGAAGVKDVPLGKILYARMKTYQGGGSTAGFQQMGQETWGGASVFAAESLYWMRAFFLVAKPAPTGATGNVTLYVKIPDLNLSIAGVNADQGDLSFIMGLRQNLGAN